MEVGELHGRNMNSSVGSSNGRICGSGPQDGGSSPPPTAKNIMVSRSVNSGLVYVKVDHRLMVFGEKTYRRILVQQYRRQVRCSRLQADGAIDVMNRLGTLNDLVHEVNWSEYLDVGTGGIMA